jgi:hypothetical protein
MDHSLINPNQLRHYGVMVNDNPYDRAPDWAMGIKLEQDERIPFYSQGSTIFFNSRYTSDDELESYPHVVLTCEKPWDPHGLVMPGGMDDTDHPWDDRVIQRVQSNMSHGVKQHHHMYETDCVSISVNGNTEQLLIERMISSVHVSTTRHIEKLQSKTRHSKYEPEHVSAVFGVGIATAKDILAVTTQEGIRHAVTPLTRQYWVDHIHLHHTYLSGKWTLDHLESKYKLIRGHSGGNCHIEWQLCCGVPHCFKK